MSLKKLAISFFLPSCADHGKVMCLARKHLDLTSAIGGSVSSWCVAAVARIYEIVWERKRIGHILTDL